MRAYCKNNHILARDPRQSKDVVRVGGHATPKGVTTAGGIILLNDEWASSPTSHEVEVIVSATAGIAPGDRLVVYVGGDDGDVSSNGISAFLTFNGEEAYVVPERFLWAHIRDGELLPRGRAVLVERDDAAMKKFAFNSSVIHAPDSNYVHGVSAAHRADPEAGGARARDSVTLQYARVCRVGPDARDVERGEVVAFSPSYMCTTLVRQTRERDGAYSRRYFALVDAEELFFGVSE